MYKSILAAIAVALILGTAQAPAWAQNSNSNVSNNNALQKLLRKRQKQQPVVDENGEITVLPEEEDSGTPGISVLPDDGNFQPEEEPQMSDPDPVPEPGPDFVQPRPRKPKPEQQTNQPGPDLAGPSAVQIERQLDAEPRVRLAPRDRVTIREFKRRPDLRRAAPSIDIQAINFAFGSDEIPRSQYRKVENIAIALERLLDRDPDTTLLIEGHTDAVGSYGSNQVLSERRAASLRRVLVREFDIPREALETVGYGEEYLLVPTSDENWRNRRVTLRSIDEFVSD